MKRYIFPLLLLLLSSCSNYLDIKNSNERAVPTKLEDLQALLDDQFSMNIRRTPAMLQTASDDAFLPLARLQRLGPEFQKQYKWQPFEYTFSNDWSLAYQPVYTSNYCLEMLADIDARTVGEERWNNVHGSAMFFKAYYYLSLLWTYAPVYDPEGNNAGRGIVLRNSSDFNVPSRFSTVEESYAAVVELAQRSLRYLPEWPLLKSRPSQWAAHALLARAYLSMGRYAEAEQHADQSLRLGDELIDFNNPADGIQINANMPLRKFSKETIFYSDMSIRLNLTIPNAGGLADTALMALFDPRDLRTRAYYMNSAGYKRFKGTHSNSIGNIFSGLTTAEMLLVRGECRARRGDLQGSMADCNRLLHSRWDRAHAFVPKQAASTAEAVALLLDERRRELAMRGLRWADIKRLNREGHNIVLQRRLGDELVTLAPNAAAYTLPMPIDLRSFLDY